MLRLHLWEVRAHCIPFIHGPDKWVNICVSATHRELSLYLSRDINMFVKFPFDHILFCLMSASRWQQWEWEWLWWQVQRWVTSAFYTSVSSKLCVRAVFLSPCSTASQFGLNNDLVWLDRQENCNWNICHVHRLMGFSDVFPQTFSGVRKGKICTTTFM